MANISRIKLDETTYEIKDAQAARASDLALKQDALTAGNGIAIDNSDIIRTTGIPFGTCDSTSTSKVFTATVPGIYKLEDGVCCIIKNGVVTSESGFTLNVNGLGAKPSYSNMATGNDVTPTEPTRDTTIFNINYAMLFVYSSTIVDGGGWICYRGYDANTNTIGYQLRHNSSTLPASDKFYRYRLLFTSADGTKYVPANTSSSTNGTASRTVNLRPIDPFGEILYYSSTTAINAGANPAATVLWEEYVLNLGYSFNRTGSALVLTYPKPVYIKCAPQTDGSAIIDEDTPYVQTMPSTNDGKIYIFLGIAYSATNLELLPTHPVYYHDGTGIRLWIGRSIPSQSDIDAAKPLIITITPTYGEPTTYSADKTFAEITSAYDDGRDLLVNCENYYYNLKHVSDNKTLFDFELIDSENRVGQVFAITTQSITYEEYYYQRTLTFDNLPTANSNNPVKSGGVYSALQGKEDSNITLINLFWSEDISDPLIFKDANLNILTHSQVKDIFDDPSKNVQVLHDDSQGFFKLIDFGTNYNSSSTYYILNKFGSPVPIELGLDYTGDEFIVDSFTHLLPTPLDIGAVPTAISTTYSSLVTKRNISQLIAGAWYRITDYTCTTTQTDTQSAGHQFDILVQATSPNTLSEEAKAIRHEGDTYFADSNLEDWKIWYCLDNDTTRFAWVDATNGKGVIYRMIDEWNNDCPYDFKNIQYKRDLTDGELDTENGTTTWVYTFNLWDTNEEEYKDTSIVGNTLKNDEGFVNGVYNNKMGIVNSYTPYYGSGSSKTNFVLPNNVFLTKGEDLDYFGCRDNTLGSDCFSNTFGEGCSNNTFGNKCFSNAFGNNCYLNTFKDACYSNTFGNECSSLTFGDSCFANTFKDYCTCSTFRNACYSNTFGEGCSNNTFGEGCSNNTFGNYCYINTFGNSCNYNTFLKPYTQRVIIENGNSWITLTSNQTPTSSNPLRNITISQGVNNTNTTKTISHNTLNDTFRTTYTIDDNGDIYAITPTKYDEWDKSYIPLYIQISDTTATFKDANNNSVANSTVYSWLNDSDAHVVLYDNSSTRIYYNYWCEGGSDEYNFYSLSPNGIFHIYLFYSNGNFSVTLTDNAFVPYDRKVNNKFLSSDITLTASDVGALPSSTHIPSDLKVGSVAGKLYRNNVGGSGNFTVSGNSGCIPNLTAGTFLVSIYAKSATQSYTFKFNFGSVSYNLSTTNGEINDVREITIPSNGTFSGSVLNGSVAAGTILYVVMYDYLTPVSTVGVAAVTNRYSDLDGTPTIPTVNNGTLTIQKNGTTVGTFTANQSGNTTANIGVPILTSVTVSGTGAVTQALDSNKFYKFGSLTSLTLTLNAASEGLAIYGGKFTADSSGCTLSIPSTVTAASSVPTILGGSTYEFNIMDNVLLMIEI